MQNTKVGLDHVGQSHSPVEGRRWLRRRRQQQSRPQDAFQDGLPERNEAARLDERRIQRLICFSL